MRSSTVETGASYFLRSRDAWRDPWESYGRLRDRGAAHLVHQEDDIDYWVLPRFAEIFDALRDPETFSSAQGLVPTANSMAMFEDTAAPIVMMDPPDHTAMRRLVSRAMTPRRVSEFGDQIRGFVQARLDTITNVGEVDIVDVLFKPLPSFVVAHFLGVPVSDREMFDTWTHKIVAANADGDLSGATTAVLELFRVRDRADTGTKQGSGGRPGNHRSDR